MKIFKIILLSLTIIVSVVFYIFNVVVPKINISTDTITTTFKETTINTSTTEEEKIIIDIEGEVKNPGVYEVSSSSILIDIIGIAGGITKKADISMLNKASLLYNHAYIYIGVDNSYVTYNINSNNDTNNSKLININKASIEELTTIKGIGEVIAKAIIEYRETNGFFNSIEDIKNVNGIGDGIFEKIKDQIEI